MKRKLLPLIIGLAVLCSAGYAEKPFRTENVMLLQPDSVLMERVPAAQDIDAYIKAVQDAAASVLAKEKAYPSNGFLVIAVRPKNKSNIWFDFSPKLPKNMERKLKKKILAISPCSVKSGVIVFALNTSLWGASTTKDFPQPPEWLAAVKNRQDVIDIDILINELWPEEP